MLHEKFRSSALNNCALFSQCVKLLKKAYLIIIKKNPLNGSWLTGTISDHSQWILSSLPFAVGATSKLTAQSQARFLGPQATMARSIDGWGHWQKEKC